MQSQIFVSKQILNVGVQVTGNSVLVSQGKKYMINTFDNFQLPITI